MEGNDMRVAESLKDLDLSVEVFFQLRAQSEQFDGLDGYSSARELGGKYM